MPREAAFACGGKMSAIAAMDTATDAISVDARRAWHGQILRTNSPPVIACSGGEGEEWDGMFVMEAAMVWKSAGNCASLSGFRTPVAGLAASSGSRPVMKLRTYRRQRGRYAAGAISALIFATGCRPDSSLCTEEAARQLREPSQYMEESLICHWE